MGRAPCCDKQGLKKGPWTPEEDEVLVEFIKKNGHGSWRSLPKLAGLLRCGKSCRLRWTNYLRPDIKRGPFTADEEKTIIQLHGILGNRWSSIASQLPGRTDNEIKNFFNTHLKKRLLRMGFDPQTHAPPLGPVFTSPGPTQEANAMRHMAQWENARLEAEERLSRESLLFSFHSEPAGKPTLPDSDYFLKIWNSDVGESFRRPSTAGISSQRDSTGKSLDNPISPSPASSSTKCISEEKVATSTVATTSNRQEELECKSCVSDPGEFLAGGNEEALKVEDSSSSNELDESATSFSDLLGSELLLDFPARMSESTSFSQQMWPWADFRTDFQI